jgi:hypothetical protein
MEQSPEGGCLVENLKQGATELSKFDSARSEICYGAALPKVWKDLKILSMSFYGKSQPVVSGRKCCK